MRRYLLYIILLVAGLAAIPARGQGVLRNIGSRGFSGGTGGNDSLEHRSRFEDSITVRFRYLDTARNYSLDSNINDFYHRFPTPPAYHYLGNVGTAAQPIVFSPRLQPGFDPGFHAFDIYKWTLDKARFFTTTRPYTELGYVLGSQTQQVIQIVHTQNLRPYWNVALQYRLINTPGFFKNQRANHNNYLVTSWYQSPNKRYNNFFVILANNMATAENGGILSDQAYLEDPTYTNLYSIPVHLPSNSTLTRDPYAKLTTGNSQKESGFFMRQQYDLGRKDSIVTDSTVIPLFYPRIRFENTLRQSSAKYEYRDYTVDSQYYKTYYGLTIPSTQDTLVIRDRWKEWSTDFSVYTFPDARNLQQFLKLGAELQLLTGEVRTRERLTNVILHGEYRNRTRNQKWDLEASGRLFGAGYNAGDYGALISLQRQISARVGSLQLGFENSNRSPSYKMDEGSNFYLDAPASLNKENTTHLFAKAVNPALRLQLGADYFLISNYLYYYDYYKIGQESSLFNLLRLSASKTFTLTRHWNWFAEAYLQQKTGNAQLNLPLFFTRQRLSFEGNFFKNLFLATGVEFRYHTPYKADGYSPLVSQFSYQDTTTLRNRPDVHAFFDFRIRSFKAYVRAENLNTASFTDGFGFNRHNFAAPDYPYPGLVIRLGIYWSFVN